jgi:folate-binding protein YgfZ
MAQYTAILSGAVRLTGADCIEFMHGQTSNDIKGLPTPGGTRTLILNAKGQIEFDVHVYRRGTQGQDDLYVQTAGGLASDVIERLKRYVVFDDVKLLDISDQIRVTHLSGEGASELVRGLGFDLSAGATQILQSFAGTILVARVDRGNQDGFDLHTLSGKASELVKWLETRGVTHLGMTALERFRVLAGLADAHRDHFTGMLPQECGLERAVSYRKGCYIGQEIMARLEARGHTNRHLARVRFKHAVVSGSKINLDGHEVGVTGSCVPDESDAFFALAVVKKDVPDNAALEIAGLEVRLEQLSVEQSA